MNSLELKRRVAMAVVDLVQPGTIVGLGTGSTAALAIDFLARRQLDIRCVATSVASAEQATSRGMTVIDLDDVDEIDLTIDGADEIDPQLNLIKGLGGALLREKLVALASKQQVIIADESKLVRALGSSVPLPVEVVPFGLRQTSARLEALGANTIQRTSSGRPFVTDNGNLILDCRFEPGQLTPELADRIKLVPGVVEHGVFAGTASLALVARSNGRVEQLQPGG